MIEMEAGANLPGASSCRTGNYGMSAGLLSVGVESPRGISPRGAHRTVREPLGSHGSYHPAARGLTPYFHKTKSAVSRSATFANQRAALRFLRLNRLYFLAAQQTNTRFR